MTSPTTAMPCCHCDCAVGAAPWLEVVVTGPGSADVSVLIEAVRVDVAVPLSPETVAAVDDDELSALGEIVRLAVDVVDVAVTLVSPVSAASSSPCVLELVDVGSVVVAGRIEGSVITGLSDTVVGSNRSGSVVTGVNVIVSESSAVKLDRNRLFSAMIDSICLLRGTSAKAASVVSNSGSAHSYGASSSLLSWHVWPVRQHHVVSQTTGHRKLRPWIASREARRADREAEAVGTVATIAAQSGSIRFCIVTT